MPPKPEIRLPEFEICFCKLENVLVLGTLHAKRSRATHV